MNAPYLLKRRRTWLSAIWLGSFIIAGLILIILLGLGFIGKNNFLLTLEAIARAYSPVLIVVAAFFMGQRKAQQLHGRPPFIAAVSFSLFWAFCVLGGLFALWRGVIAIEDAGDYLGRVETLLSFLTTGFVAWYLGSESIIKEEPMPSDDQESLPKGSEPLLSKGEQSVGRAAHEISAKARELEQESKHLRLYHQVFTILTILLGVSAPALVTVNKAGWWELVAIVVTAFAAASATIRTVLRFSERYSNSALTSIALLDAEAQVQAKKEEVLTTVKDQFKEQKLFEVSAWARKQMFEITKGYVEKDVSALTTERIELAAAPKVEDHQRVDTTKKP